MLLEKSGDVHGDIGKERKERKKKRKKKSHLLVY